MVIVTTVSLDRLKVRKVSKGLKRGVLNPRRSKRTLTSAEKAALKEIRGRKRVEWKEALEEAQEALRDIGLAMQAKVPGHQLDYYIRVITQAITRSTVHPRKGVSKWNAFLSKETRELNEQREPGTAPIKTSDVSKELSAKWKAMSAEEQNQYTEETVTSLQEAREAKEAGQHNCQVAAFNDARAVVGHIQREIVNVNQRTGMEFMLLAVRKDIKQFNAPYVFRTSDLFDSFFHNTTKFTLADLVLKLECFFIGGIDGVSQNYIQRLVQLKSRTAAIIKDKL
ncbi:hypothetical protein EST38_g14483, partial [Candolleomyces aberdarensis]